MARHMRRRFSLFLIMVVVGYVGVFEIMLPEKGGILKKIYEENVLKSIGDSQTDQGNPVQIVAVANTTSQPVEKQVFYTLAPHNNTKDRVHELMMGGGE